MRFLLSSLLVASLCEPSSWGACTVTQSPDVSVMEGESVNITCCWTEQFERLTVNWIKNQTRVKTEPPVNQISEQKSCSYLTFVSIKSENSGKYTCKLTMEIPKYSVFEGNGTLITVTGKDNAKDNKTEGSRAESNSNTIIIVLAVVAPLLLFTLVGFCAMKRKQVLAASVIYEAPHNDSEVADMDKRSTGSSTGSTQWCQVPVYESFDYFERVQTKPSG